jgi:hypothetical protein
MAVNAPAAAPYFAVAGSAVDHLGLGLAGWADQWRLELIPILKKQHTGIKIEEEINPPPLGGIFSLNFFPCVSGVKKLIFSIFFPIFSLPRFLAVFSHSF